MLNQENDLGKTEGFEILEFDRLHAIYFFVDDPLESATWYSSVLEKPISLSEVNFSLIDIGNCELCFHRADSKSPVSTGGSVGYWKVSDLKEAYSVFVEHGGTVYRGPIEIPESEEGICQIKDPFGNVIGLQGCYKKADS